MNLCFMITQSHSGAVVFALKMAARLVEYLFQKRRFSGARSVSYAQSRNSFSDLALSINQKWYFDACILSFKSGSRFSLAPELLGSVDPKLNFFCKKSIFVVAKSHIKLKSFAHVSNMFFTIHGCSKRDMAATNSKT